MELKSIMTFDELCEHWCENNSLRPNRVLVGRYAKKLGYKKVAQRNHYKVGYYYINESLRKPKESTEK